LGFTDTRTDFGFYTDRQVEVDRALVTRRAAPLARELAEEFKVVAIVGPRQSGKTTLARAVFPDRVYVSLEEPDQRRFAHDDPRRFLDHFGPGTIIDEVQRCPELLSYLQGRVDARQGTGQYILTGSQHLTLMTRIGQSLAGRVGFLQLLPFAADELVRANLLPESLDQALFQGAYPPVYHQPVRPERWYSAYAATYAERDVRQLLNVRDLGTFQRFLALCAASVGQLLNTAHLAADLGLSQPTVMAWIGVLEASFLVVRLRPHHRNFRKRLVKTPKLYFLDTGLAARLLGIQSPAQLATHAMRGLLFENWVVAELLKARANRGLDANLFFWRSHTGHEIDVVAERGDRLLPIEVKSGSTLASDWFASLAKWSELAGSAADPPWLVYGGNQRFLRQGIEVCPWRQLPEVADRV
jgi:predicted AAA+ superfamily ATPase